jgi:hypothetical protein
MRRDSTLHAFVSTIDSDPSELAILKGFDFAIDNSGVAGYNQGRTTQRTGIYNH